MTLCQGESGSRNSSLLQIGAWDFDTMADRELKETFSRDDLIFDDSDESLSDLDFSSVVKEEKSSSKV
jgi:hypothetical protein